MQTIAERRAKCREWYYAHREQERAKSRQRYAEIKEAKLAQQKIYRARNQAKIIADRERYRKLLKAKKTPPDGQTCEVCGSAPVLWDHDHSTKQHRGWLCQNCNVAEGMLKSSPLLMRRLAAYLEAAQRTVVN